MRDGLKNSNVQKLEMKKNADIDDLFFFFLIMVPQQSRTWNNDSIILETVNVLESFWWFIGYTIEGREIKTQTKIFFEAFCV
jgi:hypothetical protein